MIYYFVVCVFVVLCQVERGSSVKCYICMSESNRACVKPDKSNITTVECSLETLHDTQRYAEKIRREYQKIYEVDLHHLSQQPDLSCLKHVVRVENKEYVLRGCQLAEQNELDVCHKVRTVEGPMVTLHCSRCNNDKCNSANTCSTSYWKYSIILAALLYYIKY